MAAATETPSLLFMLMCWWGNIPQKGKSATNFYWYFPVSYDYPPVDPVAAGSSHKLETCLNAFKHTCAAVIHTCTTNTPPIDPSWVRGWGLLEARLHRLPAAFLSQGLPGRCCTGDGKAAFSSLASRLLSFFISNQLPLSARRLLDKQYQELRSSVVVCATYFTTGSFLF